jgi:hypothetical protein
MYFEHPTRVIIALAAPYFFVSSNQVTSFYFVATSKMSLSSPVISCCSHVTRTAGWLPPAEAWKWGEDCLPYGWERAVDNSGRPYYIK